MGGWSAERDISFKTGKAILAALRSQNIDAEGIDVDREVLGQLTGRGFVRAFIALHGRGGEDGVIQALLELLDLPYTGSGVLASALCMNKLMTKRLWLGAELPTPPFMLLEKGFDPDAVVAQLGMPVIVKPVLEGSSIGMTKVETAEHLPDAWNKARQYEGQVIAERWIVGEEYTVAILGERALPTIRLETPRTFYDFEAKYNASDTQYHCPCGLPRDQEKSLQGLAKTAFAVTGARGWGRVDLMLDEQAHPWLIEVNTIPGMTDHSLVPMAAAAAGITFEDLVLRILEGCEAPV
ncbi:MAG: D-alanine--D-alanine ligase [Gammaproteobacteria bacterium]|nr:D-alanine--D-alanine ligase [Gammaproteobacteria bacterium]